MHVRALLLQSITGHGYQLRALESADIDGTDLVEVRAELATVGRSDEQREAAAGRIGLEPNVTGVRWHVFRATAAEPSGPTAQPKTDPLTVSNQHTASTAALSVPWAAARGRATVT